MKDSKLFSKLLRKFFVFWICLNVSKGTSGPSKKLHVHICLCLSRQAVKQYFVYLDCPNTGDLPGTIA